jgi:hypothetical protein
VAVWLREPCSFFSQAKMQYWQKLNPENLTGFTACLGVVTLGLALECWGGYRKPARQGVFITMLIVMTAFACLTFIIALLTASYRPIPAVLCVWIVALVLLVYARQMAKDIL